MLNGSCLMVQGWLGARPRPWGRRRGGGCGDCKMKIEGMQWSSMEDPMFFQQHLEFSMWTHLLLCIRIAVPKCVNIVWPRISLSFIFVIAFHSARVVFGPVSIVLSCMTLRLRLRRFRIEQQNQMNRVKQLRFKVFRNHITHWVPWRRNLHLVEPDRL